MTSVILERTRREWMYQPSSFFEAPYRHSDGNFNVLIEGGRAIVNLSVPQDPVSRELEEQIQMYLTNVFRVRQVQVHRRYELAGPRVYQHADGQTKVELRHSTDAFLVVAGLQLDIVVRDAAGNILSDSKAERTAKHTAMLDSVVFQAAQSPTLSSMLESHKRSVNDPDNELVYLYEIREALRTYYRSEKKARQKLGISKAEWQWLGSPSVQTLEQGRHRGLQPTGRRVASATELEKARGIAKRWILDFAALL